MVEGSNFWVKEVEGFHFLFGKTKVLKSEEVTDFILHYADFYNIFIYYF